MLQRLAHLVGAFLLSWVPSVSCQACPIGYSVTFAKVPGMVPRSPNQPALLYAANPGQAITAECYNRCRSSTDCGGFIVDYFNGACFRVANRVAAQDSYLHSPDINYFRRICLQLPYDCQAKAWAVDYLPNYELLGYQHTVIPNVNDRWQCAQLCVNQTGRYSSQPCLSVQYQQNERTCTLSAQTRWSKPESFAVTTQRQSDYIENQCVHDESLKCWHELIYNQTSLRADLEVYNVTQQQCEAQCNVEVALNCRAYSYVPTLWQGATQLSYPICSLHSDETLINPGPTIMDLVPSVCGVYTERISCVNISVTCSEDTIGVTLFAPGFAGQLFVQGHPDDCSAQGRRQPVTSLVIPVPSSPYEPNRCGVTISQSLGQVNRTLASAVLVVQYHQLIQTVSDRVVKISCLLSQSGASPIKNVTLSATFAVKEPSIQSEVNGTGSLNGTQPIARLSIADLSRGGQKASETELGDHLQLMVNVEPPYNVNMLMAGHLIASSGNGQDSLLLLDWRGCPPDPSTFPALLPAGPHALTAQFRAFRFPESPILKFNMVLNFCQSICQPTDCGNGLTSYGKRRKRDLDTAAEVDVYRSADNISRQMPLQLAIIVRVPNSMAGRSTNSSKYSTLVPILEAGLGGTSDEFCASWASLIIILVTFLLLQCALLAACFYTMRRQKQLRSTDTVSLQEDFQPRHVSWADEKTMPPSPQLRLQTPVHS